MSKLSRHRHQYINSQIACSFSLFQEVIADPDSPSASIMSKATNAQEFITEFANAFSGSGDSVKLDEFFADDVVFSDYSK